MEKRSWELLGDVEVNGYNQGICYKRNVEEEMIIVNSQCDYTIDSHGFFYGYEPKDMINTYADNIYIGFKNEYDILDNLDAMVLALYLDTNNIPESIKRKAEQILDNVVATLDCDWDHLRFFLECSNFGCGFDHSLDDILEILL